MAAISNSTTNKAFLSEVFVNLDSRGLLGLA